MTVNRSPLTAHSLSWLSEHAWMIPPAQATSTDLRPLSSDLWSSTVFASRTARTLSPPAPVANTENDLTASSSTASLLTGSNWSLGHVPTVSEDATYSGTTTGIRALSAGSLTVGSFNVTGSSGTFSIRNNTSTSTDSTLTLGGSGDLGNSVSGTPGDLLFVASGATFNLRGDNGASPTPGTGVLKSALGQSGNFDVVGTMEISAVISDGGNGFSTTKTGGGALTLSAANTYSGDTTITSGKFALTGTGSIVNTPKISIAGGATFDISGLSSTLTLGNSQTLNGTGTSSSGTINGSLTLGSTSPLTLSYASGNPTLTVTSGALTLASGNPVTVNTTSALALGDYTLMSKGTGGSVAGTTPTSVTFTGSKLSAGAVGSLEITSSGLILHVTNSNAPSIGATPVTRQAGTAASNSQIATVNDADTGASSVTVTVTTDNPSNGVTISNIVNTNGTVTADVIANCSATSASFTLQASDGGLVSNATLNVTVTTRANPSATYSNQSVAEAGSLSFSPTSLSSGCIANTVTSVALQSQGTYTGTISVTNSTTGAISVSNAKPAGANTITIRTIDSSSTSGDTTFQLTVTCPTITLSPSTLPDSTVNFAYNNPVTASGGIGPYSYSISSGSVPTGLTFNSDGTWSGTPTTAGTYNFTITATDSYGCTGSRAYTVVISNDVTFSSNGSLPAGTYNNVTINSPGVITLTGNVIITGTLTINGGGTLNCGTFIISGDGLFTLNSGGTLGVGDPNGITQNGCGSGALCGNVRTGRSFSTGANYTYTGSTSQTVGSGLPSTIHNLTIANTGGSSDKTVTGNSGQTVTGTLEIISGIYSSHSDYDNVVIDNGGTLSLSADITVSGNWTLNAGGTFTHNNHGVTFDGATGQTITGDTSFYDFTKSVSSAQACNFTAGSTTTVSHSLTLTGASGQLLSLRSTSNGTRWNLNAPSTQNVNYVDVKDSDGSSGNTVHANNSTDSLNNLNWTFGGSTISGTLFDTSGNPISAVKTIKIFKNGVGSTTSTTNGSGVYTFSSFSFNTGDTLTVFVSGDPVKGATVTRGSSGDITNLNIKQNQLTVRHEDSGPITNANLHTGNPETDTDLTAIYTVPTSVLTTPAGKSIFIFAGSTFAPGASVIDGGDWTNNGTFTAGSNTVTMNGTLNQTIGGLNNSFFATLTINPSNNATVSLARDEAISTALNISSGTFNQGASASDDFSVTANIVLVASGATWQNLGKGDLTLSANVTNNGTINFNANGAGCEEVATNDIQIRSNNTTQRTWSGSGTFSMTDVDVDYQKVPGAPTLPLQIIVNSGTDGGHNTGWTFANTCNGPYTWIGGPNQDWTIPTNWSPVRPTAANTATPTTDQLIFDADVTPGPTVTNVPNQTIVSLQLTHANHFTGPVTLQSGGTNTLTINGGTGADLDVPAGATLTLAGSNALTISLIGSGHECTVAGQLTFQDGAHQLLGTNAGEITMTGANAFTTAGTYSATTHPFGTGSTDGVVVFQPGARGAFNNGLDPFGGSGHSVVTFIGGSIAAFYASSAFSYSGRSYGYLTLDGNQTYMGSGSSMLTVQDTFEIESGSSFTLSNSAGGDLNLLGSFLDQNTGAAFDPLTRTVKFQGNNMTQTISKAGGNTESFFDVFINESAGGKVQLLSPLTINGQLNLSTADSLLELNTKTLTLNGTVIGGGNLKGDSSATLNLTGTGSLGTLNFLSGARTLSQLTMNRTSSGSVTLANDLLVDDALNLTNGVISMGTFTLTTNGNVTRSSGYIIGNQQRYFSCPIPPLGSTCSVTFDVGTANGYSPVSEVIHVNANTTYHQTIKATGTQHPSIHNLSAHALQRYWTVGTPSPAILSADITFNYLAGDVVGTPASYVFFRNSSGVWSSLAPTGTPTSTSATINGVSLFSDWTLAEAGAVIPGALAFSAANYNNTEQNSGTHPVTITVRRTGGTDGAVTVHYATSDGTATTADNDYDATFGDLNWSDGDGTDKTFTVTVHGDTNVETNETVNLTLNAATGGATVGGTNPATLTIVNDDTDVSVAVSPIAVLEDGATNLVYTFTRAGITTGALTVNFSVGGTATFNTDYTQSGAATFDASSGTVSFGAGDTAKTVTIDPTADTTFEPDETVTLKVTSGTGYTVGSPSTATGAIINDDATLVVNTTADTDDGSCTADPGGCTLREAINAANSDIGNPHAINFEIPATDTQHFYYKDDGIPNHVTNDVAHVLVTTAANDAALPADPDPNKVDPDWPHSWWSIRPTPALPAITGELMIDGYSQPDASVNTQDATDNAVIRIELNGVNAGANVHGLSANGLSFIQGLAINRFSGNGVALLSGSSSDGYWSVVSGNFIGTDVSGTLAAPNGLAGLFITNSTGQQVGCTVAEERNIISGNTGEGVEILTSGGNFVQGNFIGVAANGTSLLGNGGHGIEVYASGSNNTIGVAPTPTPTPGGAIRPEGGSGSGCQRSNTISQSFNQNLNPTAAVGVAPTQELSGANIIAGNTGDGVKISSAGDINNLISQNSVYSNGGLGINLVNPTPTPTPEPPSTVTANDPGDADEGPNHLQNFPVITAANVVNQTISGTLNTTPNSSPRVYTIEFFANASCDTSGHGEGKTYLGSLTTSATDNNGDVTPFTFNVPPDSPISGGDIITATAIDANGNTSEFSACFATGFGISGHVGYCITPSKNVPGVTLNITGSSTTSTVTDSSGNYNIGLAAGGTYTLTPGKTALSPQAVGIDTADVLGVQRHFLGIALLNGCAATAADANGDLTIDTVDVLAIQRFYLGLNTGTGNVGQWRFNPSSRSYPSFAASQSGQNYDAIVIGDISGDLTPTRAYSEGNRPADSANVPRPSSNSNAPSAVATVSLPIGNISTSVTNFTLPVTTSNIDSADNLQAFQGEFSFDSAVVTFQATPASGAGLTASNWNVSSNVLGAGTIKTLKISANSTNNTSLSGSGTLFNLNFTRVSSTPGQSTPLVWSNSPNNFVFIDTNLNKQAPGSTPSGSITIAGPTATQGDISGRIVDSNGNPVEGAGMRVSGTQTRLTVTDAQGNYRFDNVDTNGFYTVTPARANFVFSPAQRSFSQLGLHTDAGFNAAANGESLNPLAASEYFVRQQYLDFLNREPDEAGLNFWVNNIEACGAGYARFQRASQQAGTPAYPEGADAQCREAKRIDTSAAFFLSIEFQQTGYLVYRTYAAAYGDLLNAPVPIRLNEFKPDTQAIGNGVVVNQTGWQQQLENNTQAYLTEFVQRARFTAAYPTTLTPADFVDKLFANTGVVPANNDRAAAINEFGVVMTSDNTAARARALRRVAENPILAQKEFDPAFVLMQYFGYLRRDPNSGPDDNFSGYNFWLTKLDAFNGNYQNAEMVRAFLVSSEYRGRFPR